MTADDRAQVVFGSFDGLVSALGMVLALALTHSPALVTAAVALAVASAASMGAGEWLADTGGSLRRASVMAAATLAGSITPALPFIVGGGPAAFVACGLLTGAWVVVIAEVRPGAPLPSYAKTAGVLVAATALGLGASILAGGAG